MITPAEAMPTRPKARLSQTAIDTPRSNSADATALTEHT